MELIEKTASLPNPLGPAYLPIEALRDPSWAREIHQPRDVARIFRSSGTTLGADARSTVRFSGEGLAAYREQALRMFRRVLENVAGADYASWTGISLIPRVEEWPDSSLAQMVAWISEELPVRYVTDLNGLDGCPVWVFGTAFHWVELLDGEVSRLPEGSVVFETGGTKGRTRSVTREGLYGEISERFGVPQTRIVSEYGMCELAAQAYDYVPAGVEIALGARRFRFEEGVETRVTVGPGETQVTGVGALVVRDPMRIDLGLGLRTEDLVEMTADGFRLLGRLPAAPLKGCSLLAEKQDARASVASLWTVASEDTPEQLLSLELGSPFLAASALADLDASMPKSEREWADALRVATNGGDVPKKWLFVLPENHSIAGLYPLSLAARLGLDVTVRVPARLERSLLTHWIADLNAKGAAIKVLPSTFRIVDADHGFDAILAYGEDTTIDALRAVAGVPVQGFGSRLGVALFDADTYDADGLAKDALSLAQRGCLSTRVAIALVDDNAETPALAAEIAAALRRFWNAPLPALARVALDVEAFRLARLGFTVHGGDAHTPLVATCALDDVHDPVHFVTNAAATRAFSLPLLTVQRHNASRLVKTLTDAGLTKSDHAPTTFQALGRANAPLWDGRHESRPLFVPS